MESDRQSRGLPLEPVRDYSIINNYDVLITDISDTDLSRLGSELGIMRLSQATSDILFPVTGVVYGRNSRLFVPLVVEKRSKRINVLFLYDTGSPGTFLRHDTLQALGFVESIPDETDIIIQGERVTVSPSRSHYENVDLLGQDFVEKLGAVLTVNYKMGTLKIEKSP
jgi:hypothetical protein